MKKQEGLSDSNAIEYLFRPIYKSLGDTIAQISKGINLWFWFAIVVFGMGIGGFIVSLCLFWGSKAESANVWLSGSGAVLGVAGLILSFAGLKLGIRALKFSHQVFQVQENIRGVEGEIEKIKESSSNYKIIPVGQLMPRGSEKKH